jgi:hypothetical protein
MSPFGQNEIDASSGRGGRCLHVLLRSSFQHTSRKVDGAVCMFSLYLGTTPALRILFNSIYLQVRALAPRPRRKAGDEGNVVNQGVREFCPLATKEAPTDRGLLGTLHAHLKHSICI